MTRIRLPARAAFVLSALIVCATGSSAQTAYRVKDIASDAASSALAITSGGVAAGATYFGTYSQDLAYAQLWRTDGTSAGTRAVVDFGDQAENMPASFTSVPFGAYFFTGGGLWRIDASGIPVSIRDIGAAPASSPVALGNTILFVVDRNQAGELWASDGTTDGTAPLATPGFHLPSHAELMGAGNRVFFAAIDDSGGWALWKTDGTPSGTLRVLGVASPPEASGSTADGLLLFVTPKNAERSIFQLWRSDGTGNGTVPIAEFGGESGACPFECAPYGPLAFTRAGNRVAFVGSDGVHGHQLWSTDGTPAGTVPLTDVVGTTFPGSVSAGEQAFFSLVNSESGTDLWVTDGTPSGTTRVDPPDAGVSYTFPFAELGGRCVFQGSTSDSSALWITDGTYAGTVKLVDLPFNGSYPYSFTAFGDSLLFVLSGELWQTDGTPAGTERVPGLPTAAGSNPSSAARLGDRLLFVVRRPFDLPAPQATLWVSDGTDAGTQPLATFVHAADDGLAISRITPFDGAAFFAADDGVHGSSLWRTDGTTAGTRLVADLDHGFQLSNPYELFALPQRLLFGAWDGQGGALWSTDGTGSGTRKISTANPGGELFDPVALGDAMIYLGFDEAHGLEPWRSDGTPDGTELLFDLNPGSTGSSQINRLATLGGRVYFAGNDGSRWGLWSTDGTPGSPTLVREFAAPFGYDIVAAGEYLYFTSDGNKLWRSDGTESGTVRLVVTEPWIQGLTAVGANVFFVQTQTSGSGTIGTLWTSDGTLKGTRPLSGVRVGLPNSYSVSLASIAARLLFSGSDGEHGYEPWVSDGTAEGTRMLADIATGLPSSGPQGFTVAGNLVYFSADDGVTGRELWAIPLDAIADTGRAAIPVDRAPRGPRDLPPRP